MTQIYRIGRKIIALIIIVSFFLVLSLRWMNPLASAKMLQYYWSSQWDPALGLHYTWSGLERVSSYVPLALVAAEDQKFATHLGFDFTAIGQALKQKKGRLRGASTISQQLAKNLFLWSGRSFLRKGLEAYFTFWLELLLPKRRILELYMNIAEFGQGVFGIEAASQTFFNKTARQLSRQEAALLAAVLPNPIRYKVNQPSARVYQRAAWIQQQMRQLGDTSYLHRL